MSPEGSGGCFVAGSASTPATQPYDPITLYGNSEDSLESINVGAIGAMCNIIQDFFAQHLAFIGVHPVVMDDLQCVRSRAALDISIYYSFRPYEDGRNISSTTSQQLLLLSRLHD
jgi:hypothetical protein